MFPTPLDPYILYIKAGIAIFILVALAGMGMYIKMQSSEIETLGTKLKVSEDNNTVLNNRLNEQNVAIRIANEKYKEVQVQLNEANGLNRALAQNVGKIKGDLGKKPLPTTCPDAMKEMRDTAKKVGDVWKK